MAEHDATDIDSAASDIISLLDTDDTGAPDAANGEQTPESDTGGDVDQNVQADIEKALETEEVKGADTEAEVEAAKPPEQSDQVPTPIEPPASWKADEKDRFKALPPETQKYLVERESEREARFTKSQQEVASVKREAEAERTTVQKERESYSKHVNDHTQQVNALFGLLRQSNPIIAQGDKTDWDAEFARDPQSAAVKQAQYSRELNKLGSIADQVQKSNETAQAEARKQNDLRAKENFSKAIQTLQNHPDLGPIWKDDAKRKELQEGLNKFLGEQGLDESERQLQDPRALVLAKMAMERAQQTIPYADLQDKAAKYDKLMAEQAKIPAAKKPPAPLRVVKPQASGDDDGVSEKDKALLARAGRTSNIRDVADLIARTL